MIVENNKNKIKSKTKVDFNKNAKTRNKVWLHPVFLIYEISPVNSNFKV